MSISEEAERGHKSLYVPQYLSLGGGFDGGHVTCGARLRNAQADDLLALSHKVTQCHVQEYKMWRLDAIN